MAKLTKANTFVDGTAAEADEVNANFDQLFTEHNTGRTRLPKTGAYTVLVTDVWSIIDCTSGTFSLAFTAAASLGDGWMVGVRNSGTGVITIDPNGSETIDGQATIDLGPGQYCEVYSDGSNLKTVGRVNGPGSQYYSQIKSLTDGATIALDWNDGNVQQVTLGGNRTFTFANPRKGARYIIIVKQDGTGSRTVTWPTIKWAGGSTPTLTTTASKKDVITLVYDYDGDYLGSAVLNC